jgi:hypothetical protein
MKNYFTESRQKIIIGFILQIVFNSQRKVLMDRLKKVAGICQTNGRNLA